MAIALKVAAILMLLVGGIWILQGFNILPGSFMTGQLKWAAYGGILCVAGLGVLAYARTRQRRSPSL